MPLLIRLVGKTGKIYTYLILTWYHKGKNKVTSDELQVSS